MKKRILVLFLSLSFLFFFGCTNKTYKVSFLDRDGNIVLEVNVEEGGSAVAPSLDEIEGYELTGWNKDFSNVTEDLIVYPQYQQLIYEVVFKDYDGSVLKTSNVEFGEDAIAPSEPTREKYTFFGWDKSFINVTTNLVITAIYEELYTINFYDKNNEVISTQLIEKGEEVVVPTAPNVNGYEFTSWDTDYTNVNSDLDIKPLYQKIVYSISYYDGSNKLVLMPNTYTIEDLVFLPEYEKDGYDFLGWYSSTTSPTKIVSLNYGEIGNKTFYAKFEKIEEEVQLVLPTDGTFMFTNIKKVPHSTVANLYVYQPDFTDLSVSSTSVLAWNWESLDTSVATISTYSSISVVSTGYAIIKATLKTDSTCIGYAVIKTTPDGVFISSIEEANSKVVFTVKFTDDMGTEIETQSVKQGGTAILPTPPTKEGYTFVGWDTPNYNIQSNVTIKATYIEGQYSYAGKKISILGDSISTYKGYIPDGYSYFYPYPTADVGDVNQTWWMEVVNTLGMTLIKNNSWSGSCVSSGTGTSAAVNDSRLNELLDGNTKPDVIIIFMGANDCGSKYVSLSTFTTSYKTMLDKIKILCPDAEIFLCTLPPSGLYTAEDRALYNNVIRDYATTYDLAIIDLETIYTQSEYTNYVVDSCHPNKAGMETFANQVITDMLKSHEVIYQK